MGQKIERGKVQVPENKGDSRLKRETDNETALNKNTTGQWDTDKFIVLVGKWAEPIQEKLTELLEQEFSETARINSLQVNILTLRLSERPIEEINEEIKNPTGSWRI